MTRVILVGELYNADLSVGGGPVYPPAQPPGVIAGGPGWLPRPPGPVDPGYSPPWARPPVDPGWGVTPPVDPGWGVRPPVDPGYSPPWARPQPPGIWGGPPLWIDNTLPIVPPQQPIVDPVDPTKMHLVAYIPSADGTKMERITFTVDKPASGEPPTEATPKG